MISYLIPRILMIALMSLFLLPLPSSAANADKIKTVAGLSSEEALQFGERMYRDGILPSGEPMRALVQGDIPVDSTMFSCASCHLRSGLGSLEGQVITYPIDGITLYMPLSKAWNARWVFGSKYARSIKGELRSAYTDESLATAIRGGVNPDGKALNFVMPRYPLSDKDMEIMVFYLKNLSVKPSPGFGDGTLQFATVIAGDVSKDDREAATGPLKLMVGASESGKTSKMARMSRAFDPENPMNQGYVKVAVSVWDLKGPRETWQSQLEEYYRKKPVFALTGGIGTGNWKPVYDFCEEKKMPCILPVTDLPVISEDQWYSVYFSKGYYQEGEAAAKYLHATPALSKDRPVAQILRNDERSLALAKGFEDTWSLLNDGKVDRMVLKQDEPIGEEFWRKLASSHRNAIVLMWLDPKDLASISKIPESRFTIFLSSTLLGKSMLEIPEKARNFVYMTYPYRLPKDFDQFQQALPGQAVRKSIFDYPLIQAKTNLDVMIITKSIFMLKGYFIRDRLLEVIDMMKDETMIPLYPRLSFGPGQRYISKGCYIIKLGEGPEPKVIGVSDWVIP